MRMRQLERLLRSGAWATWQRAGLTAGAAHPAQHAATLPISPASQRNSGNAASSVAAIFRPRSSGKWAALSAALLAACATSSTVLADSKASDGRSAARRGSGKPPNGPEALGKVLDDAVQAVKEDWERHRAQHPTAQVLLPLANSVFNIDFD